MASLYKKVISGKPYWYLREMGWVDGKPKMISERYVGTAADIEALLDAREEQMLPERTRHLDFGAVAAVWGLLADLGVAGIIDEEAGARPPGLPLSPGTYLALAALNRVVDPCSKRAFADWWRTTAADRFTKIGASALDHRRFWDAMHAVPLEALPRIEEKLALAACARFGLDTSSVALDMTNFATFIDTGNARAPVAQRGKAKQKRADLRLVGLGLVVTRDGGVPLLSHAYPGNKPDVTQFPQMIRVLAARHAALAAATGQDGTEMTVVFDAGQNSEANFALLAGTNLHYVGSVPASDCRDLLAVPADARAVVDEDRFGQLTAYDTRRVVYGTGRRAILTHSPELHAHQARGFDGTTLAKATRQLDELAATLARGKTRRARDKVEAEITKITHDAWVRRVITWHLTGDAPRDLRLTWSIDAAGRAALEEEIFGKHVLITDHDDWPAAEVIAGVPVPVRSRVLLPADERPARGVVLPDVPLDRAQHPRARPHLRPGPADRPPDAPAGPARRAAHVSPRAADPARRHRRDHPDLPRRPGQAQSPPDAHRDHQHPGQTHPDLPPGPLRPRR